MRRWIVEETGEYRIPQYHENFLNPYGKVDFSYGGEMLECSILDVTEIPDEMRGDTNDKCTKEE